MKCSRIIVVLLLVLILRCFGRRMLTAEHFIFAGENLPLEV